VDVDVAEGELESPDAVESEAPAVAADDAAEAAEVEDEVEDASALAALWKAAKVALPVVAALIAPTMPRWQWIKGEV